MSRFKMIIGLLLVSAMLLDQQLVGSDRSIDYLHEINAKHDQLDKDFIKRVQDIFYDTKIAAEAEENLPLLAVATAMAEFEAVWYAAQRKGLICSELLLIRYFVAQSSPLDRIFVQSDHLIDMMVKRTFERSIKDTKVLSDMAKHRKRIYLYLIKYDGEVPGVDELARKHAQHIVNVKALSRRARQEFEQASNKYRSETPPMEFEGFAMSTMTALESMIDEILTDREVLEMEMTGDYKALVMEVMATKLKTQVVGSYKEDYIQEVNMDHVSAYEDAALRGPEGIASYVKDMDEKISIMERRFADTMKVLYFDQQKLGQQLLSYPLLAISCQMAELQGLLYADMRRMLLNIKALIAQQTSKLEWIFEVNQKAIEFLLQHLIGYSIEHALNRVEYRRKQLYLSIMRYQTIASVRELARAYLKRMYDLKNQLRETEALSELYKEEVMIGTDREHLPVVVEYVNDLAERGISIWTMNLKDLRLLSMSLEKSLFLNITAAHSQSFNKIYRPSKKKIDSVSLDDIERQERDLLGMH